METETHRRIRERAYEIWVESGHRHGQDEANWARAERELDATPKASGKAKSAPTDARSGAAATAKTVPAKAKAAKTAGGAGAAEPAKGPEAAGKATSVAKPRKPKS